jgi:hypothetical protein
MYERVADIPTVLAKAERLLSKRQAFFDCVNIPAHGVRNGI